MKLNASLAMVTIPSNDIAKSKAFFEKLLGIELIRNLEDTESYHTPISEDGIDLQVGPARSPQETPMFYFAVDNLDSTLQQLSQAGGKVVWGPQNISMSDRAFQAYQDSYKKVEQGGPQPTNQLGRSAVVQDPGGRAFGLIQVPEHLEVHFQAGKHQKPLSDKQMQHRQASMDNARRVFHP